MICAGRKVDGPTDTRMPVPDHLVQFAAAFPDLVKSGWSQDITGDAAGVGVATWTQEVPPVFQIMLPVAGHDLLLTEHIHPQVLGDVTGISMDHNIWKKCQT